jgi:hypothetical protein
MTLARSRILPALASALLLSPFAADAPAQQEVAAVSSWQPPEPNSCSPDDGLRGWPLGQDAPPLPFRPGDTIDAEKLPMLEAYFPPELWANRERFFYEGMRLEIGPCFADYSPPGFYSEATAAFRGQAALESDGGLTGYTAGLPFHPDEIRPDDERAGLRWAWNVAHRYQAGGFRGNFRISDMVGRSGRAEPFEGELFKIQLSHRADRAAHGYQAKRAKDKHWVAGGRFFAPFDAREYAWRQYRDLEHQAARERSDDLHAYLPNWRRVRRLNASGVEGIYMPSFSVGVVKPSSVGVMGGAGDAGVGGGAAGAIGGGADAITTERSGFEGLEIRPLLYHWEMLGVQDVLSPINASTPAYPEQKEREFGPWGLSFASDRWDLRRALVLRGRAVLGRGADEVSRMVLYADLETLTPLYYMSWDSRDEAIDVGMYVGRWSEQREGYPRWPDDPERPVRVIDSVGASFAHVADIGGWRRETWEMVSTPPSDNEVRRLISVGGLTKGR